MQAITSLLGSIFGRNSDATDAEVQQRLTLLEQTTAKQKVINLIISSLLLIFGVICINNLMKRK